MQIKNKNQAIIKINKEYNQKRRKNKNKIAQKEVVNNNKIILARIIVKI